ncbi:tyrosine-type recombinase/integrase [Nocardioides sp. C4-1]|uniref:tyrosine-type recombinase/integrase n=1 Tax=Nocardioides sp. C4-1 TaxID=3151851 RepID=UPI0032675B6D
MEESESLKTRITSSRNSFGNAFGMVHILPAPTHIDADQMSPISAADPTVHHGALAYLLGINALRASEAAAVRIEDYAETLRGHRVLHLVGKGNKPATMPITIPVLRVLEACRGERQAGPLILRPLTGKPVDRRDVYRMVQRIAHAAAIPRHISPHSLRHAAITNALDAGVPLRDAQILARHADPRTTEHYDRARGNLDRHGVHFLTAYVAGV